MFLSDLEEAHTSAFILYLLYLNIFDFVASVVQWFEPRSPNYAFKANAKQFRLLYFLFDSLMDMGNLYLEREYRCTYRGSISEHN